MNWDAIGAIGEVVGALAVFITLGYLAVQIRQNTKAVRATALEQRGRIYFLLESDSKSLH